MRALVVFHDNILPKSGRTHPLSRFLRKGFWHCFVCLESNGLWIRLDGECGVPVVQYLTPSDEFDLAGYYRDQGCVVVETRQRDTVPLAPLALRNCVGLVKAVLCVRSWAVTPWQLYRYLKRNEV